MDWTRPIGMEAKAAAAGGISLSAPLHRCCCINIVAPAAGRSAQRLRKCRRQAAPPPPLRSFAGRSLSRTARVYAAAAAADAPAKDQDLVFVAGATGKVGSRTVRELIKQGFRVRAAVRSAARATPLVKSVEQLELGGDASARLEVVECDLEKQGEAGIAAAIGGASLVVCSIGASEKEILDVTGPYRIDYVATANLVRAAAAAAGSVDHFVLVTSLGTSKIGFPATLLNLFWGVLCWKRRAEEALIASGIPYTIVRPGGMERPTDAYKETHNMVLAPQDTYSGGQVSNLQVAELIACIAKNRAAAYCKVVEVIAETTAPLLPMEDILASVPSDPGRAPPPPAAAPAAMESPPAAAPVVVPAAPPAAKAEQRPLSPYTAYEGLKPPSSPTPSSSSKRKDDDSAAAPPPPPPVSNRPLSPYTAFVDLKPPASPSPSPPRSAAASSNATTGAPADAAAPSTPSLDSNVDNGTPTTDPARPLSPYARYDELKPPTSPTPTAPKV